MLKKYEAATILEACEMASKELGCNINELDYKIVQYPSKGLFGLFAKSAIIEIKEVKQDKSKESSKEEPLKEEREEGKEELQEEKDIEEIEAKIKTEEIVDSFFSEEPIKKEKTIQTIDAKSLEEQIKNLMSHSCFDIDTIEVDIEDNTAYVFIDGEDAALLIGKEGYRYNALSYILFNWINAKYGLYLKLEIAQFLASQQEMIKHQMQPVIEHVKQEGWGKTKELNGILVQIALEYLRETFPNKYVAIKKSQNGERYIVINDFNKR